MRRFGIFLTILLFNTYTCFAQTGQITLLQTYTSDLEVVQLFDSLHLPLLIYRGAVFSVSTECFERKTGGGNNDRATGGGNNDRAMGGGNNNRATGGGNNDRALGGGNNARKTGGGNDDRATGGGNNTRATGGGNNDRAMGGGNNQRATGGANNDRATGGGNNDRKGGGGSDQIYCEQNTKGEIILHLPGRITSQRVRLYYNGNFISETDNFFIIK